MLDIRLIRENPEEVKRRLQSRGGDAADAVDAILEIDVERRRLETRLQELNGSRKRISKAIGALKAKQEDSSALEAEVREIGEEIDDLNRRTTEAGVKQRDLLLRIPNLPHPACPQGENADANPVIREWGNKPEYSGTPLDHVELGARLGLFDPERATKISGSGFICFTGKGARLQRALIQFMLDLHTEKHGYLEVNPPYVIRRDSMEGTGQLPKFEEDMYGIEGGTMYLAPTAEVPVTNLHREEILALDQLPKKFVAHTPCFRREAGSAGRDTRGMIRVHQFDKVELVKLTLPEDSYVELESLTQDAETVLQLLGLHYRVIELCTGDLGFSAAKTYDIEVWAPGQGRYLEVSSCSNFEDFQARRMNLRFKDAEKKNRLVHTLNGSGVALPRLYVALLETYQQPDGTVLIPEPLRPYMKADKLD
jgi:seryl-tRNA synthetase